MLTPSPKATTCLESVPVRRRRIGVYQNTITYFSITTRLSPNPRESHITWWGFLFSLSQIYGSGLRSGFANTGNQPFYIQFDAGIARQFTVPASGKFEGRVAVVNLGDWIYPIRSGSGIGVFAPQYGPRRSFYGGLKWELPFLAAPKPRRTSSARIDVSHKECEVSVDMQELTTAWEALRYGGPMVYPLLFLGVIAMVIILDRAVAIRPLPAVARDLFDLVETYGFGWDELERELKTLAPANGYRPLLQVIARIASSRLVGRIARRR